jgi:hypothetical protein
METIMSNSKCEILWINNGNKCFLALQIFVDEKVMVMRDQCHMIVNGVNNLSKKQVLCKDDSLMESFRAKNIHDVENMGNTI